MRPGHTCSRAMLLLRKIMPLLRRGAVLILRTAHPALRAGPCPSLREAHDMLHHIPENDHVGNRTPTPRETIWYAKPLRHTAIWLPWRLELPSTAYKAAALPIVLQKHLESKEGFEPSRPAWKAGMLSVKHHSDMCVIVFAVGTIH